MWQMFCGNTAFLLWMWLSDPSAGRKQFARHEWAQKAAYLLGCTLEELSSGIFKTQGKGTRPRSSSVRQSTDDTDSSGKKKNHNILKYVKNASLFYV